MDDQFLDEFNGRFDDIITFFILVIMIVVFGISIKSGQEE